MSSMWTPFAPTSVADSPPSPPMKYGWSPDFQSKPSAEFNLDEAWRRGSELVQKGRTTTPPTPVSGTHSPLDRERAPPSPGSGPAMSPMEYSPMHRHPQPFLGTLEAPPPGLEYARGTTSMSSPHLAPQYIEVPQTANANAWRTPERPRRGIPLQSTPEHNPMPVGSPISFLSPASAAGYSMAATPNSATSWFTTPTPSPFTPGSLPGDAFASMATSLGSPTPGYLSDLFHGDVTTKEATMPTFADAMARAPPSPSQATGYGFRYGNRSAPNRSPTTHRRDRTVSMGSDISARSWRPEGKEPDRNQLTDGDYHEVKGLVAAIPELLQESRLEGKETVEALQRAATLLYRLRHATFSTSKTKDIVVLQLSLCWDPVFVMGLRKALLSCLSSLVSRPSKGVSWAADSKARDWRESILDDGLQLLVNLIHAELWDTFTRASEFGINQVSRTLEIAIKGLRALTQVMEGITKKKIDGGLLIDFGEGALTVVGRVVDVIVKDVDNSHLTAESCMLLWQSAKLMLCFWEALMELRRKESSSHLTKLAGSAIGKINAWSVLLYTVTDRMDSSPMSNLVPDKERHRVQRSIHSAVKMAEKLWSRLTEPPSNLLTQEAGISVQALQQQLRTIILRDQARSNEGSRGHSSVGYSNRGHHSPHQTPRHLTRGSPRFMTGRRQYR